MKRRIENKQPFIEVDGNRITDSAGRDFIIKSISLGNWLNLEGYMWGFFGPEADRQTRIENRVGQILGENGAGAFWTQYRNNYITESDIQAISRMGFNTVKVPLHWKMLMEDSEGHKPKETGFRLLDRLIRWCGKNGLYLIPDLHSAPGGQTGTNIDDSENDRPELFLNGRYRDLTVAWWGELARRYADEPVILAYDLLNEPLTEQHWSYCHKDLRPLFMDITGEIRRYDRRHAVSVQGPVSLPDWSVLGEPFDNRLLYQFHYFSDDPSIGDLKSYLDFRDRFNVPIWCGGFGENTERSYRLMTELFEEHRIGWSFWAWKKMGHPNNPVTIPEPEYWQDLQDYMKTGKNLSPDKGQLILNDYLGACRFDNCTINRSVFLLFLGINGSVMQTVGR